MGIISRSADLFYTYKFLRLLVTPWEETEAYKLGIIDKDGKVLIRPSQFKTSEQKDAYTTFNRLVFNIKRLLQKVPGGQSRIGSYAAALFLIKEELGIDEKQIKDILAAIEINIDTSINESASSWNILADNTLAPGTYTLVNDIILPTTNEIGARKGTRVVVHEGTEPHGIIFNEPVFKVNHVQTKQEVFVTALDLIR